MEIEPRHCNAPMKHTPHPWTIKDVLSVWMCHGEQLANPLPSDDPTEDSAPTEEPFSYLDRSWADKKITVGRPEGLDVMAEQHRIEDEMRAARIIMAARRMQDSTNQMKTKVEDISPRQSVLDEAIELITGDRNAAYGPPTQDFKRTAKLLEALGFRFDPTGQDPPAGWGIQSYHVAMFVIQLKQSRLAWNPTKRDSWVDTGGYAGCGYECAIEEED